MAPVEFDKAGNGIRKFESTIKGLNEKFGGAMYSSDEMVAFYAKPGVCKTLLTLQEIFGFASKGLNVLYVGTEGGEQSMIDSWYDTFAAKYKPKGKMFVEVKKSLSALTEYLGFKTNVVYKSSGDKKSDDLDKVKGKMEFRVVESKSEGEIDKFIKENNIDILAIDSISSPIRQAIVDEQQNNPAKASAMALICGKLLKMQEQYKIGVIVTVHAMFNPADPYETSANLRGGVVIAHYCKRVVYLDARDKRELKDYRRAWIARAENKAKFDDVVGLKINDAGIEECSVDELLTDNEREKLEENRNE
jgi:predicted ATP-dependent serine protease